VGRDQVPAWTWVEGWQQRGFDEMTAFCFET